MTRTSWVSVLVYATGCAIAVVGIGIYEAWWTAAFAIGGALVGLAGLRLTSPARPVAIGAAASGAALLGGMSVFLFFGTLLGGGSPWFLAAVGSVLTAIVLLFVVRRLLMASAGPHDLPGR
ncbi:MAG TPA: hypothetical protein VGM49_06990 [Candidatus Limnocylindrales bacterium]|jgi:hypothetical protein